jgi:hypothetical protein
MTSSYNGWQRIGIVVWVVGFIVVTAVDAFGEPNKVEYELRERCGKRAQEVWKRDFGDQDTKTRHVVSVYENHYNSKLNKCFLAVNTSVTEDNKVTQERKLYDVDENKTYARYSSDGPFLTCTIYIGNAKRQCGSELQWLDLIQIYIPDYN